MNKKAVIQLVFAAGLGLGVSACSVHSTSHHAQETRYGSETYSAQTAAAYNYKASRYGESTAGCGVYLQPCGYVVQYMPVQQLQLRAQVNCCEALPLPEPLPPVVTPEPEPEPPVYVPPTPEPPVYIPPTPEPPTYYPPVDAPKPPTWLPPKK